jgi:hypothetical protein
MALEKELATYNENLPQWKDNEGKFVLIHGEEVAGFYTSYEDAIKGGYEKYRLTPFLVKQINSFEQVHFISRFIDPCLTSPAS